MLPVKLPHRFDPRALLVSQTLAHLRTERRPMVSAHVRFKTRCQQRAHRRKHRLAAVHAHSALRRGSRSRRRLRRLHRRSGLRLHLRGDWRLRLSGGRERHHRAQSNHHHLSLKFFHAFCRSPHSVQLLFLFPPVAVPRTEGHIWERSMSCHDATASCQFTSPHTLSQGIPLLHLRIYERSAASASVHYRCPSLWNALGDPDNACPAPGHLLTVEMPYSLARDGRSYDSTSHENSPIHSRMFARRDCFTKSSPRATCSREYPAPASLSQARRAKRRVCANPSGQKAPFPGSPADRPGIMD